MEQNNDRKQETAGAEDAAAEQNPQAQLSRAEDTEKAEADGQAPAKDTEKAEADGQTSAEETGKAEADGQAPAEDKESGEKNASRAEEKDEFFDAPPVPPARPVPPSGASFFPSGGLVYADPVEPETPQAPSDVKVRRQKWGTRVCAIILALLIAGIGFLGGWFGYYFSLDPRMRDFLWATETTKKQYYQSIDEDKLYSDIMDALESQVDQYSRFFTAEEYEAEMRENMGESVGIGISIVEEQDGMRTFLVVQNSPAERAGIERGMYIVGYGTPDGAMQTGTADEMTSFLSAQTGEFVLYCATQADGSDAKPYLLEKAEYHAAYCLYRDNETSYSFRGEETLSLTETNNPLAGLGNTTAYIRLDYFLGNAAEEFRQCLSMMKQRGRTNLILDLRCNGGGYMNLLAEIASHLCKDAEEKYPNVVTAKYANGAVEKQRATGNDYYDYFTEKSRIVVLADENTASASECLIGAMVDYGTIGYDDIYLRKDPDSGIARTYGKGIMQSYFPSASGSVMKLTVATVHWPVSDTCIHGKGVTSEDGANAIEAPFVQYGDDLLDAVIDQIW